MRLRPRVLDDLRSHGVEPMEGDSVSSLRERLNDAYLEEVRGLRSRVASGEIPLKGYAQEVSLLKDRFPLLGLPADLWERGD